MPPIASLNQPAGVPRVVLENDEPTARQPLPRAFHDQGVAILVSRSAKSEGWPPDPDDLAARALFEQGQVALYEQKDPGLAIQRFQSALQREAGYVKAWVALTIALVAENTPASLADGERVLRGLLSAGNGDALSDDVARMLRTNLGFLYVHRSRHPAALAEEERELRLADREYEQAVALSGGRDRVGTLAIWAYVKARLGESPAARGLWERARRCAPSATVLEEYRAKYPELVRLEQ